jgi:hypothetical protein
MLNLDNTSNRFIGHVRLWRLAVQPFGLHDVEKEVAAMANTPVTSLSSQILGFPSHRISAAQTPSGGLVRRMQERTQDAMGLALAKMFEQADDTLFDFVGPHMGEDRNGFFEGFREMRLRRGMMERVFNEEIAASFARWSATPAIPATSQSSFFARPALALVEEDQLEEDLAFSGMVSHAEGLVKLEASVLERRLAVMRGSSEDEQVENPISPVALASAFRLSMNIVEGVGLPVRLVVYKLFERQVMDSLPELYANINKDLANAGVLPNLKSDINFQRNPVSPDSVSAQASVNSSLDEDGGTHSPLTSNPYSSISAQDQASGQVAEMLRALISRHMANPQWAEGDSGSSPGASSQSFVSAPTMSQVLGAISSMREFGSLPDPASLRANVLAWLMNSGAGPSAGQSIADAHHQRLSGDHEVAIEMISLLFEFILEDHALPPGLRATLGRLQLPYLRAALAEPEWFADQNHPARVLLSRMAEAGKGCSELTATPLTDLIEKTVEQISQEQAEDGRSFQFLCERFTSDWNALRERAMRVEERAAQTVSGRERRDTARRQVAHMLVDCLAEATALPSDLREVITRAWAHYMVVTQLRYGDNSPEMHRALRVVSFIAAVGRPAPPAEVERQELLRSQSSIEDMWRGGLITAGMHESDVNLWEARLASLCDDALSPLARAAFDHARTQLIPLDHSSEHVTPLAPSGVSHPSIMDVLQEPVSVLDPIDEAIAGRPAGESQPFATQAHPLSGLSSLEQARSVRKGQWIEITSEEATPRRLRLSWVSGLTGRLLFVTPQGQRGWEATRQDLADAISAGRVVLVEDGDVMERAITTIRERLLARLNSALIPGM